MGPDEVVAGLDLGANAMVTTTPVEGYLEAFWSLADRIERLAEAPG